MPEKPAHGTHLHHVLGATPDSASLKTFLASLRSTVEDQTEKVPLGSKSLASDELFPIVKSYGDGTVYHSYPSLGIDLEFRLFKKSNHQEEETLHLIGIDIENHERNQDELVDPDEDSHLNPSTKRRPRIVKARLGPYVGYPIGVDPSQFSLASLGSTSAPKPLQLSPQTIGKVLIEALGEPTRKGGHDNLISDSGIWLEWTWDASKSRLTNPSNSKLDHLEGITKYGLFVQWRGAASFGAGKWDKGKDRQWGTLKVFAELAKRNI